MSYDYGLKHIAKHTGLTGVEAKNIVKSLQKQNLDYDRFDWKTIGEDLYGHGKRIGGVKKKLKSMYGITLDIPTSSIGSEIHEFEDISTFDVMGELMEIHERRSPHAKAMDLSIKARKTFKPTDKEGVKKWKKAPNMYDIIGIDDPII